MTTRHEGTRLRHPIVLRTLVVQRVAHLSPRMLRVTLGGDELSGFSSAAPDDHVKLFLPLPGQHAPALPSLGTDGLIQRTGEPVSPARDYTPRRYDAQRNELDIDFVLHGDGPASNWAAQAAPGQLVGLGGPRGSFVVADDFDAYVLIGDETALPAIGRWLEEMPATARACVLVEIEDAGERQVLASRARVDLQWIERTSTPQDGDDALERALRDLPPSPGDSYYWIAAESRRVRRLRRYLVEERGIDKDWVKATGYWKHEGDTEDD